jgi:hypothetical protein
MSAQAILRAVVDDPEARPLFRVEAEQTLRLLEYLKVDDEEETILYLLGTVVGLQERVDALEKALAR